MSDNLFAIAQDFEAAGDVCAALEEYGRLIDAGRDAVGALLRRSALYREIGKLGVAEADLQRAIELSPSNPWPKMRLGQLAGASGRNATDATYKQAALDLDPHNLELRVNAVAAYAQLDWLDRAYAIARTLPEGLPDWWAGARQNAIQRYRSRHAATRSLLRTRRSAPDRILFVWDLCQQLFELGRLTLARRLCEALMKEIPSSFPAFFFCSRIIARQSGPAAAADFLSSLSWLHCDSSEYPFALARQLHELGLEEEVLARTGNSRVEEDQEELRYIKSVAMLMLGRGEDLQRYCRDWLICSPYSVPPAGFITAAHFTESAASSNRWPAVPAPTPRIVQFWDKDDIPTDVAETMASWIRYHPACGHVRFTEAQARTFLDAKYGSASVEIFDFCHHVAMKADYFRIAYLLQEGGIWVDADEQCLRPFPSLLADATTSALTAPLSGDTPGYLHNFFLGAKAGSPILRFALQEAEKGIGRDVAEGLRPDIWQVTGPGLITRAAAAHLISKPESAPDDVITLPLVQYHALARTNGDLAYKRKYDTNWQLA